MEMAKARNVRQYMCFVDLKAAYDTVDRVRLLQIIREYGVTLKLHNLLNALYLETRAAVRVEGELTEWFEVNNGLRQGCLLSPALFNIYIDRVIRKTIEGLDIKRYGIEIKYTMPDGRRHLNTINEGVEYILELLYADDLVLICNSQEALNEILQRFEKFTREAGLTISVAKTKQLITETNEPTITESLVIERGDEKLEVERVKSFTYLGSMVNESCTTTKEIERRINLGLFKFQQLRKPLWNQSSVSIETKLTVYKATVLSTVLYGSETWTCSDSDYAKLNAFHTKKLRSILGLKRDQIHNKDLFQKTRSFPLEDLVRKNRLRWAGHVRRLDESRLPKKVLFGSLNMGKTSRGRPKKNWLDNLKSDCEKVNVPERQWEAKAKDRTEWRRIVSSLTPARKT